MIVLVAVLVAVIVAQQALFVWASRSAAEERRRLLAAVMAKNPGEFVALERATAPRPAKRPKKQRDEFVPAQPYGL